MNEFDIYDSTNLMPVKSQEEIQELFKRYHEGDLEARKILIESNMRLVFFREIWMFKHFSLRESPLFEQDDFTQCGLIGLIKGIDSYNQDKKIAFSTYVTRCIDNELFMYLRGIRERSKLGVLSLDFKDENGFSIADFTKSEDYFEEDIIDKEVVLLIRKMIDEEPEQIRKFFEMYFGLLDDVCHKQADIANQFGISQSYVSIILNKELKMMKKVIEDEAAIKGTKSLLRKKHM